MILINPEFHRHIWLNFSPFRLLVMPIVLGLILYVFSHENIDAWQASIFPPAFYTFIIVVFLWGNYEAASASGKDTGQNTWDFQKMSSLSPSEVLIGKLFGSTSYVWYTGFILLAIMIFSYDSFNEFAKVNAIPLFQNLPSAIEPITYILFSGLIGHATAFFFGTGNLRRNTPSMAAPFIMGVVASFASLAITTQYALGTNFNTIEPNIEWHAFSINQHSFLIYSLLYSFFWIIVASYRSIREELQFRNSPIVFMVFLISFCIYISGFSNSFGSRITDPLKLFHAKLFISFMIILLCTYTTIFMSASDLAKYKRWIYAFKDKEWKRFFVSTPLWVGCCILLLPIFLLCNALGIHLAQVYPIWSKNLSIQNLTFALILFTMRDGLIYHSILLGKIERHKFFLLVLYIFSIYALLPYFVANTLGSYSETSEDTMQHAMQIFYPMVGDSFFYTCVPILVQAIIALLTLRYIVKTLRK